MTFLAPTALFALVLVPFIVGVHFWKLRGRPGRATALRHIPFALFMLAATALIVSLARPEMNVSVPARTGTVILAVDTSNSMLATDADPTRFEVARQLAVELVEQQPSSIEIGIVSFTTGGMVTLEPTTNRPTVLAALERLRVDGGTSLTEGIFASLEAIVGEPIDLSLSGSQDDTTAGSLAAVDIGTWSNAAIVVLSDGEERATAAPTEVVDLARRSEITIFTVGVGRTESTPLQIDGFTLATSLDEAVLQDIAAGAGGSYQRATDGDLTDIFDQVERRFHQRGERIEVTSLFGLAGLGLTILGGVLSLRWFGRVI